MKFDILTIFPNIFSCYLNESMMKRAQAKNLVKFNIVNIRDHATDKHKKVDDRPYGGGPGMILKVDPIYRALHALKIYKITNLQNYKNSQFRKFANLQTRIILLSAKGKLFTQNDAKRLAKYDRLIFICGRYEGVDERVVKHLADEELSIGPYILTGGELPAMVVIDAVSRHIPGFLGKAESLHDESYNNIQIPKLKIENCKLKIGTLEYPQYTRPEVFSPKKGVRWAVPKILLTGDHKKINKWRHEEMK